MQTVAQNNWRVEWVKFPADADFENRARRLAGETYSRDEHN
jgi:hypothetical protein